MVFIPKKFLGQHFLIDPNIRAKILASAGLSRADRVVEIGPGQGFLTEGLLQVAGEVIAIEFDPRCLEVLRNRFSSDRRLQLVHADALEYPYEQLPAGFKVVSNLPYNISTALLFRLLKVRHRIGKMVLMLQREVALRLSAGAGSKHRGALSVAVQFLAEGSVAFHVSPHCFRPRPKVSSSVVIITPRAAPPVPVPDEEFFLWLVRQIFLHRRKLLKNSLAYAGFSPEVLSDAISDAGVDPKRRPETLTLAETAALSNALFEKRNGL